MHFKEQRYINSEFQGVLTELQALARSTLESLLKSVLKTFIFSTKQVNAVSVASPTFSYTPFD